MVAYGFKRWLAEPIRFGLITHTLRDDRCGRSRHARTKEHLQLYVGLRTKHARKILDYDPICRRVVPVTLRFEPPYHLVAVLVDGAERDRSVFAVSDGFGDKRIRAKAAWFSDGKARWLYSATDVMGCFWRYSHPVAFAQGQWQGQLIGWRKPRPLESLEDYEDRYGSPIDAERQRILAAEILPPPSGSVEGLPPDLPDLGVA